MPKNVQCRLSGSLCESLVHPRYIWFNSANREDERRGRRGPDGARWSPPTIWRARAIAWAPCTTMGLTAASTRRATRRTLANQPVVNDDNSVIAGWCEHAPGSLPCFGTTPIVDGRTQCMPLSAAVVNRRSAGRHAAPESMLVLTVARKPVARLPRGECSDQH